MQIEFPSAAYCPKGLYSFSVESKITNFEIIIYQGPNNASVIQTSIDSNSIWYLDGVGLMSDYPRRFLNDAVDMCGNLALFIGFSDGTKLYNSQYFSNTIDALKTHSDNQDLNVVSPKDVKNHFLKRNPATKSKAEYNEYIAKRNEIEEQIEEINDKIKDAYFNNF